MISLDNELLDLIRSDTPLEDLPKVWQHDPLVRLLIRWRRAVIEG